MKANEFYEEDRDDTRVCQFQDVDFTRDSFGS